MVAAEVPMAGERSLAGPSHSLLFGMIERVKGGLLCIRGEHGPLVRVGERLTSVPH